MSMSRQVRILAIDGGGFQGNGRIHTESTKYSGDHFIQCFVIKNGICIAKSHEFVVRII